MISERKPVLVPAYGRDYTNKAALLADIVAGKDFLAEPASSYINLEEIQRAGWKTIQLRYGRQRKVAVLDIERLKLL